MPKPPNPADLAARIIARAVHAGVAEYRRLEPKPAKPAKPAEPADAEPAEATRTELSCTGGDRRDAWRPTHQAPAAARAQIGFRSGG